MKRILLAIALAIAAIGFSAGTTWAQGCGYGGHGGYGGYSTGYRGYPAAGYGRVYTGYRGYGGYGGYYGGGGGYGGYGGYNTYYRPPVYQGYVSPYYGSPNVGFYFGN